MSETLENLYSETRTFPPPAGLAASANVKADAYDEAAEDRLAFWEKQAERLSWAERWNQVLDWSNAPFAKWFVGGKLGRRRERPRLRVQVLQCLAHEGGSSAMTGRFV